MRTLHAWTLTQTEGQEAVEMPEGTMILGTRLSSGGLQLFGIVPDGDAETETRFFYVSGHGHRARIGSEFPDAVGREHYVGTESVAGGPTWHIFETTNVASQVA